MSSTIYTISSGESDDDSKEILPSAPVGVRSTVIKLQTDNQALKMNVGAKMEIDNENKFIGQNDNGETNRLVEETTAEPAKLYISNRSLEEMVDLISVDGSIPTEEEKTENAAKRKSAAIEDMVDLISVDGSIPTEEEKTENAAKRKSAGSSKGKGKKTLNAALQSQTKKQKLAAEKAAKVKPSKLDNIYKIGECMKYMSVEGHPSLWERWYMSEVPRELSAAGAHVSRAHALCSPGLLVWTRAVPRTLTTGQVELSPSQVPCDRALYIAEAEELCELVSARSLSSHLSDIRQLCDCKLTLLVFQLHDYFNAPRRKTSNSNRIPMTEIEFELAIADLLVAVDCDTVIANTPSELALTIVQVTKAIAEAPAKKAKRDRDDQAAFFMRGDNKNCVAVDKDGVGVGRLWQQMLAVLPHSSLATSRAICAHYPSPLHLYESLQSPGGVEKLAQVGVSRAGGGARARRLGAELARRLHVLLTCGAGSTLVQ